MSCRVLIVEDDAASRELLREMLTGLGYEVSEAHDGRQALDEVAKSIPDLIIMDLQMPVMDGFGTIQHLQQDPRYERLPVIALTAFAMRGDRERVLEAGFSDYLTKPLNVGELRRLLANLARGLGGPDGR